MSDFKLSGNPDAFCHLPVSLGGNAEGSSETEQTSEFSIVHPNSRAQDGRVQPTKESALQWQRYYRLFNKQLFDDQLPDCLITLVRRPGTLGYFRPHAYANRRGVVAHQIALNSTYIAELGDLAAFQTLTHEMCHLWRQEFGPKNKNGGSGSRGYHDRHWAGKMEAIGLMPSDTGAPGGKKTGYKVSDYVIDNGPFDKLARLLLISDELIEWRDHCPKPDATPQANNEDEPASDAKPKKRLKFTCETCQLNAWAKPTAKLDCGFCGAAMLPEEQSV